MFIRTSLCLAYFLMTLAALTGFAAWPHAINHNFPGIPVDALLWGFLGLLVNGTPMLKQLLYRDSAVSFDHACKDLPLDIAEALWQQWYARCGITRADFKLIIQHASHIALPPSNLLELWHDQRGRKVADRLPAAEFGEFYYYIIEGQLDVTTTMADGVALRTIQPAGGWLDEHVLLALLSCAPIGIAMQQGPSVARVAEASTFSNQFPPTSEAGSSMNPGARLLRFRRADLVNGVIQTPTFAADALRILVYDSLSYRLFLNQLKAMPGDAQEKRFHQILEIVRKRAQADVLRDAATIKVPLYAQLWSSLKWFWHIHPGERAMNAVVVGSRQEKTILAIRRSCENATPMEPTQKLHRFEEEEG